MYLYEGSFSHPNSILKTAETALKDFHQARAGNMQPCVQEGGTVLGRWMAPSPGWYKANWDAAIGKKDGRTGLGVVIRDHQGNLRAARSLTRIGILEPAAAEALAATLALQLSNAMGLMNIWLEGDAKTVVAVESADGDIIDDIRHALTEVLMLENNSCSSRMEQSCSRFGEASYGAVRPWIEQG
jgi:hypothetical protein